MMFFLHLKALTSPLKIIHPKMSISASFKHKEKIILEESTVVTVGHIKVSSLPILTMSWASRRSKTRLGTTLDEPPWPCISSRVCAASAYESPYCLSTLLPPQFLGHTTSPSRLSRCATAALMHDAAPHLRAWTVASQFLPNHTTAKGSASSAVPPTAMWKFRKF